MSRDGAPCRATFFFVLAARESRYDIVTKRFRSVAGCLGDLMIPREEHVEQRRLHTSLACADRDVEGSGVAIRAADGALGLAIERGKGTGQAIRCAESVELVEQ